MSNRPTAEDVLDDIRSDMIDSEIMQKRHISAKDLRQLYRELFESKSVDIAELYCRPVYWDNSVDEEPRREFPRLLLAFILPVHDMLDPEVKGIVADVTEKGMKLEGIESKVGEKKRLVINPSRFGNLDPIPFEAECRWAKSSEGETSPTAGFRITDISETALQELRRLIRFVTTGRAGKTAQANAQPKEEEAAVQVKEEVPPIEAEDEGAEAQAEDEEIAISPEDKKSEKSPASPSKKDMSFKVSFNVNCPDQFKEKIAELITNALQSLKDVNVTDQRRSEFHIAIFAVEGDMRLFCSVAITRTVWTDVEFCMRRALLDMWERISEKPKEGLLYRGAVINEVLQHVGTDNSLKGIQDHWPMVVTPETLDKACEKIVSYLDSKFLEPRRRRRKS